jgi:6-phosphofructokinase 2
VPSDFYARAAAIAAKLGARFFLDTSGPALAAAIEHGVTLIKPSLNEMRQLIGTKLADRPECIAAARRLIASGRVEVVVLSLAHLGAVMITNDQVLRAPAIPIDAKSSVGAGDSFLSAMVLALSEGRSVEEATKWGIAAGAAALLRPGTKLCDREIVTRLVAEIERVNELAGPPQS